MTALVDGVTAAVVGVSDPAPHVRLWCEALGWEVVEAGTVEAADASALWGVDHPVDVRVLAAPGATGGRLHLLHLPGGRPPGPPRADRAGLQGLDLYARDLDRATTALAAAGWSWRVAPLSYDVALGERTATLTEASVRGPDDVPVVLVRPAEPRVTQAWTARPDALFTELTSVVVTVADVPAEKAFWAGLGLREWYDVTVRDDELDRLAELPPGTAVRIAFMAGPGTARVEVFGLPEAEPEPARPAVPGHDLGHAGWSVRVTDLDTALAGALGVPGTAADRPLAAVSTPLHGNARVATVRTPGGVAVELWQESATFLP